MVSHPSTNRAWRRVTFFDPDQRVPSTPDHQPNCCVVRELFAQSSIPIPTNFCVAIPIPVSVSKLNCLHCVYSDSHEIPTLKTGIPNFVPDADFYAVLCCVQPSSHGSEVGCNVNCRSAFNSVVSCTFHLGPVGDV